MSTLIMAKVWPMQMPMVAKAVYISLADNANDHGVCWPSIPTIAKRVCAAERTVFKAIKWLEENQLLVKEPSQGKSTRYKLTPDARSPLNDVHPCTTFTPPLHDVHPTPAPRAVDPCTTFTQTVIEPSENHKRTVSTESTKEQTPAKHKKQKAPYELIMQMYNEILHELPPATELTDARKKLMDGYWYWLFNTNRTSGKRKATNYEEAIEYSKDFFYSITQDDFVMGRTPKTANHQNWKATIDYILSQRGRTKCVEMARYRAKQEQ